MFGIKAPGTLWCQTSCAAHKMKVTHCVMSLTFAGRFYYELMQTMLIYLTKDTLRVAHEIRCNRKYSYHYIDIWEFWHQKEVSQTGLSNCIPQYFLVWDTCFWRQSHIALHLLPWQKHGYICPNIHLFLHNAGISSRPTYHIVNDIIKLFSTWNISLNTAVKITDRSDTETV